MGFSILGLVAAFVLAKWVLKQDAGTEAMQKISNAIKQGAEAFLRRQFTTIGLLAGAFAIVLFIGYGFIRKSLPGIDPVDSRVVLAGWITASFVFGAICSLIAGYTGMWVSHPRQHPHRRPAPSAPSMTASRSRCAAARCPA